MYKLDRTMILALLTVLSVLGAGCAEAASLADTAFFCSFGFVVFGIATLIAAFYNDGTESEEETDDS